MADNETHRQVCLVPLLGGDLTLTQVRWVRLPYEILLDNWGTVAS
jgi:hypothetical protein